MTSKIVEMLNQYYSVITENDTLGDQQIAYNLLNASQQSNLVNVVWTGPIEANLPPTLTDSGPGLEDVNLLSPNDDFDNLGDYFYDVDPLEALLGEFGDDQVGSLPQSREKKSFKGSVELSRNELDDILGVDVAANIFDIM